MNPSIHFSSTISQISNWNFGSHNVINTIKPSRAPLKRLLFLRRLIRSPVSSKQSPKEKHHSNLHYLEKLSIQRILTFGQFSLYHYPTQSMYINISICTIYLFSLKSMYNDVSSLSDIVGRRKCDLVPVWLVRRFSSVCFRCQRPQFSLSLSRLSIDFVLPLFLLRKYSQTNRMDIQWRYLESAGCLNWRRQQFRTIRTTNKHYTAALIDSFQRLFRCAVVFGQRHEFSSNLSIFAE